MTSWVYLHLDLDEPAYPDGSRVLRPAVPRPRDRGARPRGKRMSNAEIAAELFISPATDQVHISLLLTNLAVRDRAQLVMITYETDVALPGARCGCDPNRPWGEDRDGGGIVGISAAWRLGTAVPVRSDDRQERRSSMHRYQPTWPEDRPDWEPPNPADFIYRDARDVAEFASLDALTTWRTWPEVWHLDLMGRWCCCSKPSEVIVGSRAPAGRRTLPVDISTGTGMAPPGPTMWPETGA